MSGATTPCVHCGATVPTPEAFMDAEGAVCADCNASAEMGESFAKAYKSLAIGTLSSALLPTTASEISSCTPATDGSVWAYLSLADSATS